MWYAEGATWNLTNHPFSGGIMSSVLTPIVRDTASEPAPLSEPRLLTAADLAVLPDELPSGPAKYELDNGRLIIMAPPGGVHGSRQVRIGGELYQQGERQNHGTAFSEVGIILWRNPDRVVAPDAAFVTQHSHPLRYSPEGYLETIPELVVEVRSKNDRQSDMEAKVTDFLRAGVQLVWVIDPQAKTVTVNQLGSATILLQASETLTAGEIIPEFKLALAELFRD